MVSFPTKSAWLQGYHRVLFWVHYFSWYTSMTYQNLTTDKTRSPSSLMTMLYGLLAKMYNLQQNFCVRNGDKTQSWKNQGHHIFQVSSRQKFRTRSRTIWLEAQNLSSSEISRNHFRLQIHFQKHFEEILGRCNTRYHRIRQKWGPSPSIILQYYEQCVRPIFDMAPFRP